MIPLVRASILVILFPLGAVLANDDLQAIAFGDEPLAIVAPDTQVYLAGRHSPMYLYGRSSIETGNWLATNQRVPTGLAGRIAHDPGDGVAIAFEAQGSVSFNASDDARFGDTGDGFNGDVIKVDARIETSRFGDLTVGYGATASDGLAEQDLSGTAIVTGADMRLIGGDFAFEQSVSGGNGKTGAEVILADSHYRVEGLGRRMRLRYDSPAWRGLRGSFSTDRFGAADVALRWRRDFDRGWRAAVAGGVATGVKTPRDPDGSQFASSFSVIAPWGTGATMAFAAPNPFRVISDRERSEFFYYGKISQTLNLFDFGSTSASLDYGFTQWHRRVGEDVEKYGVALTQQFWRGRISAYASLHTMDLDEVEINSEVDETQTVTAGVVIRF